MKFAIAISVLGALLAAPIACAIVVCPAVDTHDCCPQSKSFAACPFDILTSAKAALPAVAPVVLNEIAIRLEPFAPGDLRSLPPDQCDLYLSNRVLRI